MLARRCLLQVYEGIYCLLTRNLKRTSELFLDSISTFNSPDIITYARVVKYTVLTSLISVGRSEMKKRVSKEEGRLEVLALHCLV